ncbi:hypothetical protein [Nocardia carnea]|uniref:hypothetical protein n=1 Tax=Nocardia carnea TaxID=37328 RepID=UPI0024572392|nr:hypothetical protein [Nocardia carnea]
MGENMFRKSLWVIHSNVVDRLGPDHELPRRAAEVAAGRGAVWAVRCGCCRGATTELR